MAAKVISTQLRRNLQNSPCGSGWKLIRTSMSLQVSRLHSFTFSLQKNHLHHQLVLPNSLYGPFPPKYVSDEPLWLVACCPGVPSFTASPFCTYYQHQPVATTRWCFTLDVRPPLHTYYQHPLYVLQAPLSHDSSLVLVTTMVHF